MKTRFISLLLLIPLLFSFTISFAQEKVYNRDIPTLQQNKIVESAELAAKDLMLAILQGNQANLNQYFPSKEVYSNIIQQFYDSPNDREIVSQNLEKYYQKEKNRILKYFADVKTILSDRGHLSIDKLVFQLNGDVPVEGGNFGVILKDKNNQATSLTFFKFYQWENKWYLTGKVRLNN